jgi:hypothetical protein
MRKIIDYFVIYADILDDEDFDFRMGEALKDGYQPFSSPTFDLSDNAKIYIAQAMVKYEEEN